MKTHFYNPTSRVSGQEIERGIQDKHTYSCERTEVAFQKTVFSIPLITRIVFYLLEHSILLSITTFVIQSQTAKPN